MDTKNTEQPDRSPPDGEPTSRRNGETITRLQIGDREFILVGTAHISKDSVEEVREVILKEEPERVCIEIDETAGWGWRWA